MAAKSESRRRPGAGSAVNLIWAAVCALILLFCAWINGNNEASHFLITAAAGAGLLLLPPRRRLPAPPLMAAAVLLLLASVSLLPASWFGVTEPWRTGLPADWQLPPFDRVSPQPFLTQGALLTLLAALLWFFMLLGRAFNEGAKRAVLTLTALGIVVLAGVALAERFGWLVTGWPYQATHSSDRDMGPFMNRNHFSGLCAVGCVLCAGLAQDGWKRRSPWWPFFVAALLAPFSAIAMNTSRGGLLLFFIGMMAWLALSAKRYSVLSRITVMASLAISAFAVLVLYGEGAFGRITLENLDAPQNALGMRWEIYREVIPLALQRFWTGAGLGNFHALFALESQLQLPAAQALHPESDWLWFAFEAGIPALLAVTAALAWLFASATAGKGTSGNGRSQKREAALRGTAAIGAGLAAVNALFDVPMHNLTLACLALMLAACAVSRRRLENETRWPMRLLFRVAGAGLLFLAAGHYSGLLGQPVLPGRFHINTLVAKARADFDQGRLSQALENLDLAVSHAPLRWDLYYQRALTRLALRQPSDEALLDFGRARTLKPGIVSLRMDEGRVWLRYDPELAIVPWRELLARYESPAHYETMLDLSRAHPALRAALLKLARTPSLMASRLLRAAHQDEWRFAFEALLKEDPDLTQLSSSQRAAVLRSWATRGDAQELLNQAETRPEWEKDAWQLLADQLAGRSDFEQAWELLKKHGYTTTGVETSSSMPLGQLERDFVQHPADLKRGIDLYFAQKQRSLLGDATRTLDRLLALPAAPAWLRQEQAALHAANGDFRRAYEVMKETLAIPK